MNFNGAYYGCTDFRASEHNFTQDLLENKFLTCGKFKINSSFGKPAKPPHYRFSRAKTTTLVFSRKLRFRDTPQEGSSYIFPPLVDNTESVQNQTLFVFNLKLYFLLKLQIKSVKNTPYLLFILKIFITLLNFICFEN